MVSLCSYGLINDVLDISKVQSRNLNLKYILISRIIYVYLKALQSEATKGIKLNV